MSNNRMWLINKRLNTRVLLAKGWGSNSWIAWPTTQSLNEAFKQDDYPFTDWELLYEQIEMPEPLQQGNEPDR